MARVFKRKDRLSAMSEINLTSLMDLVFCLLIIFMITVPVMQETTAVNLPLAGTSPQLEPDKKPEYQALTVDKAGRYFWGKEEVNAAKLQSLLEQLSSRANPPVIELRADGALPYQQVMDVITMIKKTGLTKLSLDYQVK